MAEHDDSKELLRSIVAGLLLAGTWLAERHAGLPHEPAVAAYLVVSLLGGAGLALTWIRDALKGKFEFDVDLLMLLAAAGASALGQWAEGAFLLFLFSFAHALEHRANGKARDAIRALGHLTPDIARVRRNGQELEVPIAEVAIGELVIARPGDRLAVDGRVMAGRSAVDQAPITGESVPVEKQAGDPVFAGSVNGEGALEIVVEKAVGDRTMDRIVQLVEAAQLQKAPTERFVERFTRIYVPLIIVLDILVIVVPPLLGFLAWHEAFYRAMTLLVAASPCALALGTPSAVLTGIAQAARHGVLIKGGEHLENLGNVRAIALDKTGTLTKGEPAVTEVVPAEEVTFNELIAYAAAVEVRSSHPLAQAVVRYAEEKAIPIAGEAEEVQNEGGKGIRAVVQGQTLSVGTTRLWGQVPAAIQTVADRLGEKGESVVIVQAGERWLGVIGLADQPRPNVQATLAQLRELKVKPLVMLTGDHHGVAAAVAKQLGVDEFRADLMPEDKVTAIQELLATYKRVAMIGDGVNDAPALAHATVGIAMGGSGTAVALETADIALMSDDLGQLPFAVALARQASATIRTNVFISLGVIVVLILTASTGILPIGLAVVLHEGSTLVVLANSLRLLAFRYPR